MKDSPNLGATPPEKEANVSNKSRSRKKTRKHSSEKDKSRKSRRKSEATVPNVQQRSVRKKKSAEKEETVDKSKSRKRKKNNEKKKKNSGDEEEKRKSESPKEEEGVAVEESPPAVGHWAQRKDFIVGSWKHFSRNRACIGCQLLHVLYCLADILLAVVFFSSCPSAPLLSISTIVSRSTWLLTEIVHYFLYDHTELVYLQLFYAVLLVFNAVWLSLSLYWLLLAAVRSLCFEVLFFVLAVDCLLAFLSFLTLFMLVCSGCLHATANPSERLVKMTTSELLLEEGKPKKEEDKKKKKKKSANKKKI